MKIHCCSLVKTNGLPILSASECAQKTETFQDMNAPNSDSSTVSQDTNNNNTYCLLHGHGIVYTPIFCLKVLFPAGKPLSVLVRNPDFLELVHCCLVRSSSHWICLYYFFPSFPCFLFFLLIPSLHRLPFTAAKTVWLKDGGREQGREGGGSVRGRKGRGGDFNTIWPIPFG